MAVPSNCSSRSIVPSLPPPCPKSPPEYPDLYGKRRQTAKVQMLEREIGFLEEELKSVEGVQPASRCCKEMANFVMEKSDPLIHTNRKNRRSCRFWKWFCGTSCFNLSCIFCCCCCCCCDEYSLHLEKPSYCNCNCNPFKCLSGITCRLPNLQCCCCPQFHCCKKVSCRRNCCIFGIPTCPNCSCCKCYCPKCPTVGHCTNCSKTCCNPFYLCYW